MAVSKFSALRTNPQFVFFTDFDGTITQTDSNDYLIDNLGFGYERRRAENIAILEGRVDLRSSFKGMIDTVSKHHSFPECVDVLLEHVTLDPHFAVFYRWASANNIPVIILSLGMRESIQALLEHTLGAENAAGVEVVSNHVLDQPSRNKPGMWTVGYHDSSEFGHDKSLAIKPYAALPQETRPTLFFAGDGTSDICAAREADLMFAKKNYDLITYCKRSNLPYVEYADWRDILKTTRAVVEGEINVEKRIPLI